MITLAKRAPTQHRASRSQQPGIVLGLRYERNFIRALTDHLRFKADLRLEANPWFYYETDAEPYPHACSPDVLLIDDREGQVYIIEIKYTWVPEAERKLKLLYGPVVRSALGMNTQSIVVVKKLVPDAPKPNLGLFDFFPSLYQWLEGRPILF